MQNDDYFPLPEWAGGWRTENPRVLGVDADLLRAAIDAHNQDQTYTGHDGGALLIIYRGHIIGETYVTGSRGGPQPWGHSTCNDMKSSTKSVFGTAVGVFLEEYDDQVNLETLLVGETKEDSLIPQIWDQPLTDDRKRRIKVKHALSMTSGHESREPWLAPSKRMHATGYTGPFQMFEYCFGWWRFEGIADHHTLMFDPGSDFNYSNFGLEMVALAMRNISGQEVGPYLYDRVLEPIGMPPGIRDNAYVEMPYSDDQELNFASEPGWGRGGSEGCNAYGADRSLSSYGYNSIVGSTFRCSPRDFARLGYLWLRGGRWANRQLVSAAWIRQATSRYVRDDGSTPAGYGYTFWIMDEWDGVPADLFMARGHNMNHCYVIPSLDLVVVRQGNESRPGRGASMFAHRVIRDIVAALPESGN
ncbi:MAG: serine hydrolase [Candidatus Latescibacteria bacterium]|jgi:CubicO group peptidase (beta-lactamase class C family)|nr:serine hydrolase [Candidatus Latescibacterota bacterium]